MKKIGPGGPRLLIDRDIFIRITSARDTRLSFNEELVDFYIEITFELARRINGEPVLDYVVKMAAKYTYDEDRFREKLLCSKYLDSHGISSDIDLWDKGEGEIPLIIEDFDNILPWLFPNMDLNVFFNQTHEQNANKPLRLSEGHTLPGPERDTGSRPA